MMSSRIRDSKLKSNHRQYCGTTFSFVVTFSTLALLSFFFFASHLSYQDASSVFDWSKRRMTSDLSSEFLPSKETVDSLRDFKRADKLPAVVEESNSFINDVKNKSPLQPFLKGNGSFDLHFIHIPKCGGTSMTSILREVACTIDPSRNHDCCTNPGFCDWHARRRCQSIKGCTNHIPQRRFIFKDLPSITILREPLSRILSAWFYRGHSPNMDFFQVRPYFKDIAKGLRPRVLFDEYIEMPEYQNIQTRMLGADSFPYKNITVTPKVYELAVEALERIFFVGIQEEYDLSVLVLLRELGVPLHTKIKKERDQQGSKAIAEQKAVIKSNEKLLSKVRARNNFDTDLYNLAFKRFCVTTKKYPDLFSKLKESSKLKCQTV